MDSITLNPVRNLRGALRPPGSKSIANRALPLAALARGKTFLRYLPDGEDVTLMRQALGQLGFATAGENVDCMVEGKPFQSGSQLLELFLGNSGTSTRILTALLAASQGDFGIDGVPRMRQRPIEDLVNALRPLLTQGSRIDYLQEPGFPPLHIHSKGLRGGITTIRGNLSSQFVTGLIMALPLCSEAVEVHIEGDLVSAPYVRLTLEVMESFGAKIEHEDERKFFLAKPIGYTSPGEYSIEPDASSASYFLAAGAIGGGPIRIEGIGSRSGQGEAGFAKALEKMGAHVRYSENAIEVFGAPDGLKGIDIDMDSMSDTGMTLAMVALFAKGKTVIRNVGNWRVKETDRLAAMASELKKIGAAIEEGPDFISIIPPDKLKTATIKTYDDHRIAMCFSLIALGGVPITILDPGCTRKTYPGYFRDFQSLAEKVG